MLLAQAAWGMCPWCKCVVFVVDVCRGQVVGVSSQNASQAFAVAGWLRRAVCSTRRAARCAACVVSCFSALLRRRLSACGIVALLLWALCGWQRVGNVKGQVLFRRIRFHTRRCSRCRCASVWGLGCLAGVMDVFSMAAVVGWGPGLTRRLVFSATVSLTT